MRMPATFEQSEDWYLASGPTASFAYSGATRLAIINHNFPGHQIGCIGSQRLCDQLSELVKIQDRGIAIYST